MNFFMRVPWLIYNSKGFCIGPFCRDCFYFSRDRRSPLYSDLEIYACACSHFKPRTINKDFFDPNEIIGEQLTLF